MRRLVLAVAMVIAIPGLAAAAPILYGVSSSTPGQVYTINTTTGAATAVVAITGAPSTSLVGAEFLDGQLWVTDVNQNGFSTGTVNLITGAYTKVSNQGGSSNWHSLAANQATDTFYSVDLNSPNQNLVSMTTLGVITTIGATNQDIRGLAYSDLSGVLYGVDSTTLYRISTTTGAATAVGALGVATQSRTGLAYSDVLGQLFLNTPLGLYTVNTATGAASLIGSNGVVAGFGIDGLAIDEDGVAVVPEPASLVLLGTGLASLLAKARRRRNV